MGRGGEDYGFGIAADSSGNAYVAGTTSSPLFPTVGSLEISQGSGREVFLTKYNASGAALSLSVRFGGAASDEGSSIAIDGNGAAYIAGSTTSTDFPTTAAFQSNNAGAYDTFITKISTCDFTFNWTPTSPFEATGGGGTWPVTVTTSAGCSWVATSGVPWITVASGSPGNGSGSVTFSIAANADSSPRFGTVTIAGTTFNVTQDAGPTLSTNSEGVFFAATYGNTLPSQTVSIFYGSAASTPFTATAQVASPTGGKWLTVSPTSGTITSGQATLTVSLDTSGLNFNQFSIYSGTITVNATGSTNTLTVPVTLYVYPASVSASPTRLGFAVDVSGNGTASQTVSLSSSTQGTISFTAKANDPWLTVTPATGSTAGGVATLTVSVNRTGLRNGTYVGSVTVTPAVGPALTIYVTFVVAGDSGGSTPDTSTLSFYYTVGDTPPFPETVHLASSQPGSYFASAPSTTPGSEGGWLSVSPSSGSLPGDLQVSVDPGGLTPGTYQGLVDIQSTIGESPSSQQIAVTITVFASALSSDTSELDFAFTTGGTAPFSQSVYVFLNTGGSVSVFPSATVTTPAGAAWLHVTPRVAEGLPAFFTVSVDTTGLSPGVYSGSVTFSNQQGADPLTIPVTYTVSSPSLSANPSSVSAVYQIGSNPRPTPVTNPVSVTSTGGPIAFGATAAGGSWLSVTPSSGVTPSSLSVRTDPTNLAPGTYNGSVSVSGGAGPIPIPVSFTVLPLTTPTSVSIGAFVGSTAQVFRTFAIPGLDTTANLSITSSVTSPPGGTWLSANGSAQTGAVTVLANPSGLAAGTYTGTVTITPLESPTNAKTVTVTFVISPVPSLSVPATPLNFNVNAGAPSPTPQTVAISSTGANLEYRAAPVTTSGGNWLTAYIARSGSTPDTVNVTVDPTGLAAGPYTGSVTILSPNDSTGIKTIPVNLMVAIPFNVESQPASLAFGSAGGTPPPQVLAINLNDQGVEAVGFSASAVVTTPSGGTWLSVSPSSGTVQFSPATNLTISVDPSGLAPGTYNGSIVVTVPGAGNSPLTVPVTLTVVSPLAITATCPANTGLQGQTYSFPISVAGGVPGYTWNLVSGPLPPGLTLNTSTGLISGISQVAGTYPVVIRVVDSGGALQQSATYTCDIVITPTLVLTAPCPATGGIQGADYIFNVSAIGGAGPLTWTLTGGALPPGLLLHQSTGALTGVPTANGAYPITVSISDSGVGPLRQTVTYSCNIIIGTTLAIAAPCPAQEGIEGTPYNFTVAATGGTGSLTWQLTGGTLPPGLTLNTSNGAIAGTPTASGTFPITVTVRDSGVGNQQTAVYTCQIVISPKLNITASCPARSGVQGSAYTFPVSATGGKGTLTWQLTTGALPAGVTLNPATGVIGGTPTSSGRFPIVVTVHDSGAGALQQTATYSCDIVIASTLTVTAGCPALNGVQGSPYSFTVSVASGTAPYTWQLASGPLPPGLSLNTSTGAISGTPTASGTYPISVRITDAGEIQQFVTYSCSIVITQGLTVTTGCPANRGVEGQPYSLTLAATGGVAPYAWQLTSGSLPAGLTLNPTTGAISGTPTVSGNFPVSIQVRDTSNRVIYPGQSAVYSCTISIIPALSIGAGCTAAQGTVNVPFAVGLSVSGGTPPYSYTVNGSLPPGLILNSATGFIEGTPTSFGTFPVSIVVRDSGAGGLQQTRTLECSIVIGAPKLQITSGCPASPAYQGTPYSADLTATGGDGKYNWAVAIGSLPAGLSLRGNRIGGTPAGPPASTAFTLSVSSQDQQAEIACSLTVNPPKLQFTSACPGNGVIGVAYAPFALAASGGAGAGTYGFSIVNGSLPTGLSLSNGVISGTPRGPAGASIFSLQVASGGETATAGPCTVNITAPVLAISGSCPASAQVGTAVSATVSASGGQPPYNFSFSGSPWLSFSNGTVSGTPTSTGNGAFTVSVNDAANGGPKTFSCSFPVNPAAGELNASIVGSCPGSAAVGSPVSIPLTAAGGTAPYTWSLSGPDFLSLSGTSGASVTLSGTPQAVGTFSFTVTLTDSAKSPPATFSCTITVTEQKPALVVSVASGCPAAPVAFQSPVSINFSGSGGTEPYSWSFSGPSWLSLGSTAGATTTVSGTASAAGSFTATVTMSDSSGATPGSASCTIVVNPAVIPGITVTVPTPPANPLTPVSAGLTLQSPTPVELHGKVILTFIPSSQNPIDNPQVHFSDPCQRECQFTIPANAANIPLPNVERGTVAGTIHIEIVQLIDGERNVLSSPAPATDIVVPASKPIITNVAFDNERADGFDIVISGYSPTREIRSFTLTFGAAADATLQGDNSVTRDISALFNEFYGAAKSTAGGSMFEGLRIPINLSGDKTAIGSVTVVLTNSLGGSDPVMKNR